MTNTKRHFVLFRTAGLGNQLYYCAYCDYLLSRGYKKVSLLNVGPKETGDTGDKRKRNLILEIPRMLGLKRVHLIGRIYLLLSRCHRSLYFKRLLSWFFKFHPEYDQAWATYSPLIDAEQARYNIHVGSFQSHHYVSGNFRRRLSSVIQQISPGKWHDVCAKDVAIHIRRGDFLSDTGRQIYEIIPISYYLKALKAIESQTDIQYIYLFSDDFSSIPVEIKALKKAYSVILVENQSVLEDLNLLRYFSYYILGNSTFAWWGAMLSVQDAPTVYVPEKPWKTEMDDASPYLPEWIQLPHE